MAVVRPLRILHWYWQNNGGGIHRVVSDLVREQAADPTLDVRRIVGRGGSEKAGDTTDLRFRHGFDFLRRGRVRRHLEQADLVHLHQYNPVVASALRAASPSAAVAGREFPVPSKRQERTRSVPFLRSALKSNRASRRSPASTGKQ